MQQESQKRQTAYKVRIAELISGSYVKEEGWTPNYVLAPDGRQLSRVNVMGVVIEKQQEGQSPGSLVIDDGSGSITVRAFESMPALRALEAGDAVLVIGRPREYGKEKYLVPEIVKRLEDKRWLEVRKAELALQEANDARAQGPAAAPALPTARPAGTAAQEEEIDNNLMEAGRDAEKVYETVRRLDAGDGASIDEVIRQSTISHAEEIIMKFLREGEMFEIRPGRVKLLE